MKKLVYIESASTDPTFNLALEQYVFDAMPRNREYFWLWQNQNTIVVGKHQNTLAEIQPAYVKAHDITVVRRLSGGGAVYHDLGNVNFTFIADAGNLEQLNLHAFCLPVVETLRKMGVQAEQSGRNDLTIDGKKFSGNSQYVKNGRIMHHGTLMFDSNLAVVEEALQVPKAKYQSKGFASVRSRVTNIRPHIPGDMTLEQFRTALRQAIADEAGAEILQLTAEDISEITRIQKERYQTWEWNYGASPQFLVRKKERIEGVGQMEVCIDAEHGRIKGFESFGDFFGEGATEELQKVLYDCPLEEQALRERLGDFPLERCYSHLTLENFIRLLTE